MTFNLILDCTHDYCFVFVRSFKTDAKMHRSYWGFFDRENESVKVEISEEKHLENLLARRVSKRRELSNVLAPEYFVSYTEYLFPHSSRNKQVGPCGGPQQPRPLSEPIRRAFNGARSTREEAARAGGREPGNGRRRASAAKWSSPSEETGG